MMMAPLTKSVLSTIQNFMLIMLNCMTSLYIPQSAKRFE